ncbi:MAG: uroporphyrinogen decarboxylase family protein [Eubacteriales bacterium]
MEMSHSVKKYRDFYAIKPDAPVYMREFGYYSLDKWISEGHLKDYGELHRLCGFDSPGVESLSGLGWCEAAFRPAFETKVLEDRGDYELVQDYAGRGVLFFKGRRNGFMPEYVSHPVSDMKSWEENCKWRLAPDAGRLKDEEAAAAQRAETAAATGRMVSQSVIGGYMYLRSLIGPLELTYMFYDNPELIHDCMKTWFILADAVCAAHQKSLTFDELFLAEDICYNVSSLISPDMMREFLFPYYKQLITNIKSRQADNRHLFIQIDTDGFADCTIDVYREIGMDVMSPFEVAAGCDVVRTGAKYPDLVMSGGIDKRVLAQGRDAIDRMIDRIMPAMRRRGGYVPTCDHGVPEEVPFEDYIYFRQRLLEYAN